MSEFYEQETVFSHTSGREDTAVYASNMTNALTDEFTKMRFTDNMPHRNVDNARDLTHRIQVASLDCVVDLLEGKLDDNNKAYLKGIVEALKDVASEKNFGTAHGRNKKSYEKFQPTPVNIYVSILYKRMRGEGIYRRYCNRLGFGEDATKQRDLRRGVYATHAHRRCLL